MARCLGCRKVSRTPIAENWVKWQLCFKCGNEQHPEYYKDKRHHGTGGTYMDAPSAISSMIEVYANLNKRR